MPSLTDSPMGPQATEFLRADEFDDDDQNWYIAQRAIEIGANPRESVSDVRAAIKRRQRLLPDNSIMPQPAAMPLTVDDGSALPNPPGFVGALASFIYQQAPRPVSEVAIVGALGLMAGIAGRAWHIPGSGLNLYIVLVARSAIGKEAMHGGIAKLIGTAAKRYPFANNFVNFSDFVSGPALLKTCLVNPCFVNVAGEIGHKFLAMSTDKDLSMRSLRKELTTLYSKSGPDDVAGGMVYSNQESSVASVTGVAFSQIGESTPGMFYESLTDGMMRDGFTSRYCVIEYTGDRPAKNPAPQQRAPQQVMDCLVSIIAHAHTAITTNKYQEVAFCEAAQSHLDRFEEECDAAIRAAGDDEFQRQLYNRAHLKALRVSALLAVGDHYLNPVVTEEQAAWAVTLVRHGIAAFGKRISQGDVGEATDDAREQKLVSFMRDYMAAKALPPSYKVSPKMHADGIVPRTYLQMRSVSLPAFKNHKLGTKRALDESISTLIANGKLMKVKTTKSSKPTASTAKPIGYWNYEIEKIFFKCAPYNEKPQQTWENCALLRK